LESSLNAPPPDDVEVSCIKTRYVTPDGSLDPDAVKVVRRLNRFGYEAYLVGGSIRDILFGKRPKDFDIATSALPSEVRRLFGNCRLIGRRFRLAHLLFKHGKIIEVATFRRGATEEDDVEGRHASENLFGGPADDAIRRDFTINALMYDVARKEIYDYVGGLEDIEARALRTIGNPARRFKEDPVRIIRAVKFCVRLNLSIDEDFTSSMKSFAPHIVECAPARLVEEVLKLLRSGASAKCFDLLLETTVLSELLPEVVRRAGEMSDGETNWPYLKRADENLSKGNHLSDATMLCALIYPFVRHVFDEGGDVVPKLEAEFEKLFAPMKFTKRHLARVRQILIAQRRLSRQPRSRKICQILDREYAADALDFKEITVESPKDRELLSEWLTAFAKRQSGRKKYGRSRRPRKPRSKKDEATT
jgi:poly(A) polymerase